MFAKRLKHITCLPILLTLCIASQTTHAVFIDFDNIVAPPANPFACETVEPCGLILSNEYASKGVVFGDSSWLTGQVLPDGTNQNQVLGVNGIWLGFIGTLPNFISFNVDSPYRQEASYFSVYGENDELLFRQYGSGWTGLEETSTPYIQGELVSIYSTSRIKGIYIESLFNLRVGPTIDNLTFEYRAVPEPSALLLFLGGIAGLILGRGRYRQK
jgi:hypothetical protein